ncbi:helix-turn-helix domain-containing protein [Lactococcus lactis]|uniref:helix-turn-helix domain-containing protein n=1 Tax=Lactococcus lactis TaxID=1358 RepID=UPI0032E3B403
MENKSIFYDRLIEECQKTGKSVNQVERELGYPRNALHNYKNVCTPSVKRLVCLAEYFGVSPKYFLEGVDATQYNPMQKFFQDLDATEKMELSRLCHNWLLSQTIQKIEQYQIIRSQIRKLFYIVKKSLSLSIMKKIIRLLPCYLTYSEKSQPSCLCKDI